MVCMAQQAAAQQHLRGLGILPWPLHACTLLSSPTCCCCLNLGDTATASLTFSATKFFPDCSPISGRSLRLGTSSLRFIFWAEGLEAAVRCSVGGGTSERRSHEKGMLAATARCCRC